MSTNTSTANKLRILQIRNPNIAEGDKKSKYCVTSSPCSHLGPRTENPNQSPFTTMVACVKRILLFAFSVGLDVI